MNDIELDVMNKRYTKFAGTLQLISHISADHRWLLDKVESLTEQVEQARAEERERFEPLLRLCENWLLIEARLQGEIPLDEVAHLMDEAHESGQFTTQKMRNKMRAAVRALREANDD